jgi:eukaryotic-like serine/threonine-protein kinase
LIPRDSLINQRLDEYQIEALLGKGGMARVYRGKDVNLQRTVAIKVIDTPYRMDSEYHKRFEREAQAIAQLEHSSIVHVYRFGEQAGLFYMAMQFVEGEDLESLLDRYRQGGKFLEAETILQITQDICRALDYAHQHGVIHRDLKPSNILINKKGRAILSDFGLALLIEIGTRGEVLGSPDYISPEQAISSAKVVPQSDLYSFGVILYEMFTGQVPFSGETALDLAMRHLTDPPPPPRHFRPDLSPAVEEVILKAIAKKIEDRYSNGSEFVQALEAVLSSDTSLSVESSSRSAALSTVEQKEHAKASLFLDYPAHPREGASNPQEEKIPFLNLPGDRGSVIYSIFIGMIICLSGLCCCVTCLEVVFFLNSR